MARLQHVCPNKGCRVYALAAGSDDKGDDEQEGAAHLPREKRILPELLCPGSPRCLFTGTTGTSSGPNYEK